MIPYEHSLAGVPGLSGWGYAELRIDAVLGSSNAGIAVLLDRSGPFWSY
jgi:hypothetical protein